MTTIKYKVIMKKFLFMLPILAVCFASCEKDKGTEAGGVTEDGIIIFKDQNFLDALLKVLEIEVFDPSIGDDIGATMDIDKNKDGQISLDEAKETKALNLYDGETEYGNIVDMSEIKYFTSLVDLRCYYNRITSLDVSENVDLLVLACYDNQLTSLNVSKNTKLISLGCDTNKLTTLDISHNTELTDLTCFDNQLTSLDVSNNTALEFLNCSNNPLKILTISESQQNASWLNDVKAEYPDIEIIVK